MPFLTGLIETLKLKCTCSWRMDDCMAPTWCPVAMMGQPQLLRRAASVRITLLCLESTPHAPLNGLPHMTMQEGPAAAYTWRNDQVAYPRSSCLIGGSGMRRCRVSRFGWCRSRPAHDFQVDVVGRLLGQAGAKAEAHDALPRSGQRHIQKHQPPQLGCTTQQQQFAWTQITSICVDPFRSPCWVS